MNNIDYNSYIEEGKLTWYYIGPQSSFKESDYDTLDKKIAYIKGVIISNNLRTKNTLIIGNCLSRVELIIGWLREIYYEKINRLGRGVISLTRNYSIPIVSTILCADGFLDFIEKYEF